ncbi:cytochrome o ubiquinol oxidase subunit III [Rhizobium pusense]|jgi:cytochrome o ubiquinol oxidase subunit 3|uniref:Cytochrome bo(3) ubiquinol oxidase subunit 3 n=5 Tax=Alphaproteobacteria TaxID=28211 RepID=A0AA44EGF8_9HYPH|nr:MULTISPECIES: cytochrome o ubiquinol oxidase subunit III [Rhizobium/Agrobacterium group]ANV25430.1 cytochrome o ubiquinol oxidase subunit III [Rhizobium sp. S41]EGP53912.1 cytochrome o ubiquinol oxidase subunit III [Agrobacterium tumefaciens F2]KGE80628.1 cytochrome o ubiquinol oxidase subunit III [Rhizobium sp. H41]KQZ91831.1 cytochrome o ubiquinol oxidase subunit III [Rhizobium sp. Root564]MCA2375241.1 cytochrome o ubiquinol oxidase subunit III [Agrobacterium tomkonis RTP8]MCW0983814.1 c
MANPIHAPRADKKFHLDEEHHPEGSTNLGFWLYLMSDLLIFAALFATYAVLGRNYAAGPAPGDLFDLRLIGVATVILLVSSITYGVAMIRAESNAKGATIFWLGVTGLLGLAFLGLEAYEFYHLIAEGAGPQRSAFLSSFFALVGTHGLHVMFGVIWLVVLMIQVSKFGLTPENHRRLMCLSMFWHFLDLIWIGVFSVVYLMGVVA